jgi:hypothetical protein
MTGTVVDGGKVDGHLITRSSHRSCFTSQFEVLDFANATTCPDCYNVMYVNVTASNAALQLDTKSKAVTLNTADSIAFESQSEDEISTIMSGIGFCG